MRCFRRIFERPLAVGLAAVLLAFGWQWLNVRFTYAGDWTGLFCAGANQRVPPRDLLAERLYAEPGTAGFDGQFYHYIAHDPLLRTGLAAYVDSPRLRYRRILLPGLAFLLAAGRQPAVDTAYFAVVLGFVFLGAWWLSRFAALQRRSPAWGLLFLLLPATLGGVDRMVVDIALAALWAGFAAYAAEGRTRPVLVLLALAPLARETGFAMTAACAAWALWQRKPGRAALAAATVIPCLAWYAYLGRAAAPDRSQWVALSPGGLVDALRHPYSYPWMAWVNRVMTGLDYLAAAGAVAAVAALVRVALRRPRGVIEFAAAVQGALGAVLILCGSRDLWVHIYGYGRVLSPVLLLLVLAALSRRYWTGLVPLAMILPRMGMEFAGDTWRILRGLVGAVAG
jgi:hypothetical protein